MGTLLTMGSMEILNRISYFQYHKEMRLLSRCEDRLGNNVMARERARGTWTMIAYMRNRRVGINPVGVLLCVGFESLPTCSKLRYGTLPGDGANIQEL